MALLLAPFLVAQTNSPSRPCATVQQLKEDSDRLQLLREKGVDALVEDLLRRGREFWMSQKQRLLQSDASTYFAEAVQGATSYPEMSGVLILQNGKELLLSPSGADAPEVALL